MDSYRHAGQTFECILDTQNSDLVLVHGLDVSCVWLFDLVKLLGSSREVDGVAQRDIDSKLLELWCHEPGWRVLSCSLNV